MVKKTISRSGSCFRSRRASVHAGEVTEADTVGRKQDNTAAHGPPRSWIMLSDMGRGLRPSNSMPMPHMTTGSERGAQATAMGVERLR